MTLIKCTIDGVSVAPRFGYLRRHEDQLSFFIIAFNLSVLVFTVFNEGKSLYYLYKGYLP